MQSEELPKRGRVEKQRRGRAAVVPVAQKELWDVNDIVGALGLSHSTIARRQAEGDFPEPLQLGIKRICWLPSDVREWIRTKKVL